MKAIVVVFVLSLGAVAYADVPDDSVVACQNHAAGDACDDGVCAQVKCSHYHPTADGKGEISEYDCMKCVPGEPVNGGGSRKPLFVGLGIGAIALAGGIWFAFRRGKRAA